MRGGVVGWEVGSVLSPLDCILDGMSYFFGERTHSLCCGSFGEADRDVSDKPATQGVFFSDELAVAFGWRVVDVCFSLSSFF